MTGGAPNVVRPPVWTYWPAVIVLVICLGLTLLVWVGDRTPDAAALRRRAETAVRAGDADTAILSYQHLLAVEPGVPNYAVDFARALDRFGKRGEGMNVLRTAAPETGDGDPAAHLLMGKWLIEARVLGGNQDAAVLRRAVRHLDAARANAGTAAEAEEQKRLAEAMLATAATTRPG